MKAKCLVLSCVLGAMLLTGCGASFDINSESFESYAVDKEYAYADVSADYTSYDYVDGVYVYETDTSHIELWDLDSSANASAWFSGNLESLKGQASSHSGSSTTSGGDYSLKVGDTYYRLMFSSDKGIYTYGSDKDSLNSELTALGVAK